MKYGTEEEITQKIEDMNSVKGLNNQLKKKLRALKAEAQDLDRYV